jgi:hypothetical protein
MPTALVVIDVAWPPGAGLRWSFPAGFPVDRLGSPLPGALFDFATGTFPNRRVSRAPLDKLVSGCDDQLLPVAPIFMSVAMTSTADWERNK